LNKPKNYADRSQASADILISRTDRIEKYKERLAAQRELFNPRDVTNEAQLSVRAGTGDGPLTREDKDGLHRDIAQQTESARKRKYEGPLDRMARLAVERSAADKKRKAGKKT